MTTTKNPNLRKKAYAAVTSLLVASASAVIYNPPAQAVGTPEGTVISNQATATYKDAGNNSYTSTSNLVTTTVTAVYSFVLQPDSTNQTTETLAQANPGQTQNSTAGNIVYFPYTLRNNSNATDSYDLVMVNGTASTVVPQNVELYIDTNGNGFIDVGDSLIASGLGSVNDNGTPANPEDDTTLFTVNSGAVNNVDADNQVKLIVKYQVPVTAPDASVISLDLRARSKSSATSNTALSDNDAQDPSNLIDSRNYNRVNVISDAVVAVTKAVDKATANPGEDVEYTFTITNTGNKDARNIRLIDVIPKDVVNGRITDFVVGSETATEGTFSFNAYTDLNGVDATAFGYSPYNGQDGADGDSAITGPFGTTSNLDAPPGSGSPYVNGDSNPYVRKFRYDLPLLAPGNTRTIKFKVRIRSALSEARAGLIPNNAPYAYDTVATYTGIGDTTPDVNSTTNTVNTEINRKSAALISTALSDPASPAKAFAPQTVSSNVYASTNPYAFVDANSDGVSDGDTALTDATTQDTAPANSYVYYKQVVTNRGNYVDTFNITTASNTFPSGSSVTYYQLTDGTVPSNNTSPLLDTNGDSLIDTGAIAVGASKTIVARVFIPSTANAGGTATVRATSTNGGTAVSVGAGYILEDTTRDVVTTVQVPSVNLENYIDVTTGRGYAQGEDYDTSVSANASANGTTVSYPVTVQNRGGSSDSFDLNASVSGTLLTAGATVAYYPIVSKTTLSAPASAGATFVTLSNASGFTAGDKIVINGQSLTIASVAGNDVTFSLGQSLYEAASIGEVASEAGLSPITSTTPIAPTTPISTLNGAASATATSITLASTTGLSVGDIIKVVTADAVDGEEYFTIASLPGAGVVNFAPGQALANAASNGAVVSRVPYQNVLAVVTVPVDTAPIAPAAQNVTLSTVSNNDPSRTDQVINDLVIPNFRDFTLVANRSGSAAAGTVLFYDHVLTNIGNSSGNFDLSIVTDGLNPNFIYQLLDSSNNTIAISTNSDGTAPNQTFTYSTNNSVAVLPGAGNAYNFKVKVTIPAGTAAGTVDTITVRGFEEAGTATTLSANALAGATSVTLSSVTGLVAGDLIRVVNNAGGKEYFTIDSIAGNVVNFTPGQTLKSAASSGNNAIEVIEKNNTDITTVVAGFIQLTKTVRNVTAGTPANTANTAVPGDILEYVVDYSNVGSDTALDVILTDLVPANTTYVSGSLAFDADGTAGPNPSVAKTDAIDNEGGLASANYDATAPSKVKFFLGTGQTGSTGGSVPSGGKGAIIFRVTVN